MTWDCTHVSMSLVIPAVGAEPPTQPDKMEPSGWPAVALAGLDVLIPTLWLCWHRGTSACNCSSEVGRSSEQHRRLLLVFQAAISEVGLWQLVAELMVTWAVEVAWLPVQGCWESSCAQRRGGVEGKGVDRF